MSSNIIDRIPIKLNASLEKMIVSGWGKETIENSVVEKIIYSSDDHKVFGYLAYPKEINTKTPCIIWNRGGIKKHGFINEFNARGMFGEIASWGFTVFASMYRGSIKGDGEDEFGGRDVNDVLNLIPLANELSWTNSDLWGIEGWSRGGMMSLLTLKELNLFKVAILVGAITDLTEQNGFLNLNNHSVNDILPLENREDEKINRSAVFFYNQLPKETKYLFLHGGNDTVVSPQQSISLVKLMEMQKYDVQLKIIENGDHYLRNACGFSSELRKNFYNKYLH